jgi:NTE family protein
LIGPQLLFGRAVGFYRLSGKSPIIDLPIYVGGSLEAGNVWSLRSDISLGSLRTAASVFVAADTPIGPVWLAYGQSGSTGSVYFVLGRVF